MNIGKRLVKAPKVYVRDSGLLHALLGLSDQKSVESHPKRGASWEGFALENLIRWAGEKDVYFWGTHAGAELDALLLRNGKKWGFEFKCSDAPTATKSMRSSMTDLNLERLWVVTPGASRYCLDDKMECVPLSDVEELVKRHKLHR